MPENKGKEIKKEAKEKKISKKKQEKGITQNEMNSKKSSEKSKTVSKTIKKENVTPEKKEKLKKIKVEESEPAQQQIEEHVSENLEKTERITPDPKKMESIIPPRRTKNSRNFKTLEVVVLVVLTCIISLLVGGALGIKFSPKNNLGNVQVADSEIQEFIKDYNYLIENYYGTIDKKELLNTAFKSMVDSLEDSYSGTLDENTSNNLNIELQGSYEGLGIEIINDSEGNILIYRVIPNSPASRVDLQANDKLITANNISVSGMTTTDFINNVVKGSGATDFTLVIERDGVQKTIELKKESITLQSVTSKTYTENGKKIGYLKVTIFAANTYEQFKKELQNLESQGIDSLIIDLRDNSGGHLTAVKDMIGLFLDSSHVIYQTQDKTKTTKVYSTGKETKKYPIVIVGNAMSASASEVMIAALTEEYGAILIGNQSFGKGIVQELHSLSNGDEYKFTTKKWLTPKGNWVHNNGIKPAIEVTLAKEYYSNPVEENDNQLRAALDYLGTLK